MHDLAPDSQFLNFSAAPRSEFLKVRTAAVATMAAAARADERAWSSSASVGRLVGEFDSGELAHSQPCTLTITLLNRSRP